MSIFQNTFKSEVKVISPPSNSLSFFLSSLSMLKLIFSTIKFVLETSLIYSPTLIYAFWLF